KRGGSGGEPAHPRRRHAQRGTGPPVRRPLLGARPSTASPCAPLVLAPSRGPPSPKPALRLAGTAPLRPPATGHSAGVRGLSRRVCPRGNRRDSRELRSAQPK